MFSSSLINVKSKNSNRVKIQPEKQRPHMKYEKPIMIRETKRAGIQMVASPEERKARRETQASSKCDTSPSRKFIKETLQVLIGRKRPFQEMELDQFEEGKVRESCLKRQKLSFAPVPPKGFNFVVEIEKDSHDSDGEDEVEVTP
jgi:hypothetical protein